MTHTHHTPWLQAGAAILLILTLTACDRSASNLMTPLPSAPPPTPTGIPETLTSPTSTSTPVPVTPTATAAVSRSTATLSSTATPQIETATPTATKATIGTEVTCGSALPSRLHINSYAYVNPDPPLPNNLRSEAGQNGELLGMIQPGQGLEILDGPKCVDGGLWWKVDPLDSDLTGWTAEGDDKTYWLVPCASEQDCPPK